MTKQTSFGEKPYNRCLSCPHREAKRCDGPRTSAMTLERWCEYMRDMKKANDLTNAEIAEASGISVKTIERLMAGKPEHDIMRETARFIENVIIGSSNQYPCYLAFEEEHGEAGEQLEDALRDRDKAMQEITEYQVALANIHASYQAELDAVRADSKAALEAANATIADLRAQIDQLRKNHDQLWQENIRKSAMIDRFIEHGNILGMNK